MIKSLNWTVPALIAIAIATPALSQTKAADVKYCNALSDAYKATQGQTATHPMAGSTSRSVETTVALEGCKSGDEARSIPTLEKELAGLKVALPVR